MADAIRTSTTVRRVAGAIIATVALIAATPAQARSAPGVAGEILAPADGPTTNRQVPKITLAARRDTIIAGLEDLVLTLTREGALQDSLRVTLNLTQEQEWIQPMPYTATFAAGQTTVVDSITPKGMAAANLQSGNVVVTVGSVTGYDTDDATATVHVIALGGPAATAFVERASYTFAEDAANPRMTVVARMASGMPRGADVRFTVLAFDGSAGFEDYEQILRSVTLPEERFVASNGRWEARRRIRLRLIDDDVREGVEYLRFFTGLSVGDSHGIVIGDPSGAPCPDCESRVEITDDEDIPAGDLRLSAEEIREEDESSSTASVVITNGKSFATDKVVTFTFGGTAAEGTDYVVSSDDADTGTPGYQVALPTGATQAGVTVRAMNDEVDEPDEQIEVSAVLDGSAFGEATTIGIVNRQLVKPRITLAANRDTIIAGLEELVLTARREAPLDSPIAVTLQVTQEQDWLPRTSFQLNFAARGSTARLLLPRSLFSSAVTESGIFTASLDSVGGYDTGDATVTAYVVSQEGPAIKVSFAEASYRFAEDQEDPSVTLVVRAAAGMPRGASLGFSVVSSSGTAASPGDYEVLSEMIAVAEEDFALEGGVWQARPSVPLALVDDDAREGTENFELVVGRSPGYVEVQPSDPGGAPCRNACATPVGITDDEDIPEWELSVSAEEMNEEEETSSTATLAIINGKTLAADQVVTFAFAGTATEGADYRVTPADADNSTPGHQVNLAAGSTSLDVTLTAVDDDVEDSNEEIEVSATLGGDTIGSTRTIRILNREVMPVITLAANRDTIIGSMEDLELILTREAPLDDALTVTVNLMQDQDWLSGLSHEVTFSAGQATATLTIAHAGFSTAVIESGNLTAAVTAVAGYETSAATATVFVVSQEGPAMTVSFSQEVYQFQEAEGGGSVLLIVQAAPGMPRGTETTFEVRFRNGTAESGEDFSALDQTITMIEGSFTLQDSRWQAQLAMPFTLLDDEIGEGTESFTVALEELSGSPADLQLSSADAVVEITDDDFPAIELSLSSQEIREEGETSSTATVSITNGKTFAADQMLTFELRGDAIPEHDYSVTPADADEGTGHQVLLPMGSSSVDVTFTAIDDEREEPTEEIRISVTHDGNAIGGGTIRLIDRFPGPSVVITFEGVQPPRDRYTAGVATGPFTARITFSEPVKGFTEEDITWQTHWLTTVDSTLIGVFMWDYIVVRPGLEYTARMMPEQSGRLWIEVDPGVTTSVATGDGNQFGGNSLWVELPANRMMTAPTELTVDEGNAEGHGFMVVLTSEPTGPVTVTLSGTEGTALETDGTDFLTFKGVFWTVGRVVTVTAGHDANTTDETVTLRLTASGGGYDGQSLNVVVRVKDDDVAGSGDIDDEAAALILLKGMTPEVAAAALFGEHDLSEAQLGALDVLGNRNGLYDLGDLLSWITRCDRGEVKCGKSSPSTPNWTPVAAAGLIAASRSGRSSRRGRTGRRSRPRLRRAWSRLSVLLAATLTWACADNSVVIPAEPDPGYLTVRLTTPPDARDIGAMLVVEGPDVDSVKVPDTAQSSGFELFQSGTSSSRRIIVSGGLSTGPLLQFRVPDRGRLAEYRVRLLQVAGADVFQAPVVRYFSQGCPCMRKRPQGVQNDRQERGREADNRGIDRAGIALPAERRHEARRDDGRTVWRVGLSRLVPVLDRHSRNGCRCRLPDEKDALLRRRGHDRRHARRDLHAIAGGPDGTGCGADHRPPAGDVRST